MNETLNTQEIAKRWNITPRTNKVAGEVRLSIACEKNFALGYAFRGIQWTLATGRLWGAADMAVRKLSAYQLLKLTVEIANTGLTQNDIPGFLADRFGNS